MTDPTDEVLRRALGRSCAAYGRGDRDGSIEVKDGLVRDVVGGMDRAIHRALHRYLTSLGDAVLSEEGPGEDGDDGSAARRLWVVDPLDGSLNALVGIPEFGTIIGVVEDGALVGGGVALHSLGVTVHAGVRGPVFSRRPVHAHVPPGVVPPIVLAVGPRLSAPSRALVAEMVDADPIWFAGFHRLGSAAAGCVRFLLGQYSAFVALDVRPWDVAGVLPLVAGRPGYVTHCSIEADRFTVWCRPEDGPMGELLPSTATPPYDPRAVGQELLALAGRGRR